MASRVGLLGIAALGACAVAGLAPGQPYDRTALYAVRLDPRLCPAPMCGGYWVTLANGARTRCADGARRERCYVAIAVRAADRAIPVKVPDEALARASIESPPGPGTLGVLVVGVVYMPAGTASAGGGYYRVKDTGIRCVRAPCFSYRATQVNGSTRTTISGVDLDAPKATPAEIARAEAELTTKSGLLARGRFVRAADGGRVFRALRIYLRVPQPRA